MEGKSNENSEARADTPQARSDLRRTLAVDRIEEYRQIMGCGCESCIHGCSNKHITCIMAQL